MPPETLLFGSVFYLLWAALSWVCVLQCSNSHGSNMTNHSINLIGLFDLCSHNSGNTASGGSLWGYRVLSSSSNSSAPSSVSKFLWRLTLRGLIEIVFWIGLKSWATSFHLSIAAPFLVLTVLHKFLWQSQIAVHVLSCIILISRFWVKEMQ